MFEKKKGALAELVEALADLIIQTQGVEAAGSNHEIRGAIFESLARLHSAIGQTGACPEHVEIVMPMADYLKVQAALRLEAADSLDLPADACKVYGFTISALAEVRAERDDWQRKAENAAREAQRMAAYAQRLTAERDRLAEAVQDTVDWIKTIVPIPTCGATHQLGILQAALSSLSAPEQPAEPSEAARDVLAERRRQIEVEGWTPEHDDEHGKGEMAKAAALYAEWAGRGAPVMVGAASGVRGAPLGWPWNARWWKPKDRRRDLVRAGALIIAEIERLDRAVLAAKGGEHG